MRRRLTEIPLIPLLIWFELKTGWTWIIDILGFVFIWLACMIFIWEYVMRWLGLRGDPN